MAELGADSRFQAGYLLALRGHAQEAAPPPETPPARAGPGG
ncbi:hypothetical protein [Streptomyces cremeus]|uniref:Uncharacterized protein n=1 Tax=Streptomyces cremeus TaxID=66881 RepID=A0ABV5P774_STRCM